MNNYEQIYGLKMAGIAKASDDTVNAGKGQRNQIMYDMASGEVWTVFFADENSWKRYDSETIITALVTTKHVSEEAIANAVANAVSIANNVDV